MILVREETFADIPARERLLDAAMGADRFRKTSARLREGRVAADHLSLVAEHDGAIVGTVRLWHVAAGGCPALMLGPLAVSAAHRSLGIGGALMRAALARAQALGHGAVILVGDPEYYGRFGFTAEVAAGTSMPGPFERHRLLGLEFAAGALSGAQGVLSATGAFEAVEHAAQAA